MIHRVEQKAYGLGWVKLQHFDKNRLKAIKIKYLNDLMDDMVATRHT